MQVCWSSVLGNLLRCVCHLASWTWFAQCVVLEVSVASFQDKLYRATELVMTKHEVDCALVTKVKIILNM